MKKIEAKIIADSINPQGNRITTFLLTYPRFIHSELMTHRMFSRNSASSRAIPFEKMVKMVEEDPFIPIAWQCDHKGMQGTEYIADELSIQFARSNWLTARDNAIKGAMSLHSTDNGYGSVTKQLCNRLLEPFMWHTILLTATEFSNFFELRCPKYFGTFKSWKDASNRGGATFETLFEFRMDDSQAEIHIQALAESMWDAKNESTPKKLKSGDWHIPFLDASYYKDDRSPLLPFLYKTNAKPDTLLNYSIKIATARCARLSYMTFDGEIDYEKDINLHNHLLKSHHMSPFEHCARAMTDEEYYSFVKGKEIIEYFEEEPNIYTFEDSSCGWCNNFRGFIQYRYLIDDGQKI